MLQRALYRVISETEASSLSIISKTYFLFGVDSI